MLMRLKRDLTMAEAARTPGGARVDLLAVADMVAPGAKMEKSVALDVWGRALRFNAPWWTWNLLGEQGVFLLSRKG